MKVDMSVTIDSFRPPQQILLILFSVRFKEALF